MAPFIGSAHHTEIAHSAVSKKATTISLFHHTLVTKDPDALAFHAAASLQLKFGLRHDTVATSDDRLIASPYNEPPHLLDLKRLDLQSQLLAKALTIFKPIREDYAIAPYTESFNWQAVVDFLCDFCEAEGHNWRKQQFFVVSFRSRLFPDADSQQILELDAYSHQEAIASGGLLKYWYGVKDKDCQNLATCIWQSKADARRGGSGPWHTRAREAVQEFYEDYEFGILKLVINDGSKEWEIANWAGSD